jgi:hypothetical protein
MGTNTAFFPIANTHPVHVHISPSLANRNRVTTAFRLVLALPHLVMVGAPIAAVLTWRSEPNPGLTYGWTGSGGLLGAAAAIAAVIAWFAIVFTSRYPTGLWNLASGYLRWRVRASAYMSLLRDEYPPFGEGPYPVTLEILPPLSHDRITVAFRIVLAIPQILAVWAIGIAWAITTILAWFAILFTGRFPKPLYEFGEGALRWTTRVEAYLLLLRDEYPPFKFEA